MAEEITTQAGPETKQEEKYEHTFIRQVKIGDSFGGVYCLESAFEKTARNGNIYSDLPVS